MMSCRTMSLEEGVVFLDGHTTSPEYKTWAGTLANNTQGVVAVVNRLVTAERSLWDLSPAETQKLVHSAIQASPFIGFSLIVLLLSWLAAKLAYRLSQHLLQRRIDNVLLRRVTTRAISMLVLVMGLYLVLRVSGLTRLAVTVLGGTGVAGLINGKFPCQTAPEHAATLSGWRAIAVAGYTGLVQQVTIRGTVLMDFEGNHIQIPNATVYKSTMRNYTANPNRRGDFLIGIGYDNVIAAAPDVALHILTSHPAVLSAPESLVLVESLGPATVNLRLLFWTDGSRHDSGKVKSALIRLVKRAFQPAGIAMPDEAREGIFPQEVAVHMLEPPTHPPEDTAPAAIVPAVTSEPNEVSTNSEGNLGSETQQIQAQADRARSPEGATNFLPPAP